MSSASPRASRAVIMGRVLTGFAIAFMLFSSLIKFFAPVMVRETMAHLGYPPEISTWLGVLELACTLLYAFPRTARIGAILLTGYLGGAIATNLRLLEPWLTHTLFPVWIGAFAWAGLLLRDAPLRAVLLAPRRAFAAA